MRSHFIAPKTHISLVMNNDRLSSSESVRLKKRLKDIGLTIRSIITNKDIAGVTPDTPLCSLGNPDNYLKINPGTTLLARNATVCKDRSQFQPDCIQGP